MKYFKCLNGTYTYYKKNMIYPDNEKKFCYSVLELSSMHPNSWTEIPEEEYLKQENITLKTETYEIF